MEIAQPVELRHYSDWSASMASMDSSYPDHLNPFGSDDEDAQACQPGTEKHSKALTNQEQYPEHLDPFSSHDEPPADKQNSALMPSDDYDESLNPFGVDESDCPNECDINKPPIEMCNDEKIKFVDEIGTETKQQAGVDPISAGQSETTTKQRSPSPEVDEPPPKPMPRTKKLLKKEQANKKRLEEKKLATYHQTNSLQSTTSVVSP